MATPLLLAITDPALPTPATWIDAAEEAVAAGVSLVLLRAREVEDATRRGAALRLAAACRAHGARLLLRGDLRLAAEVGADGLHLPSDGGDPRAIRAALEARTGRRAVLTRACHSVEEVQAAVAAGVDLAVFSPVFPAFSKVLEFPTAGLTGLRAACAAAPGRVIALGGVGPEQAQACLEAGAIGVATVGGIFGGGEIGAAVGRYRRALGLG